jgi:hypothetical protein
MVASWRLARSLIRLRDQVDAFAPRRSRVSDGTIGDPAHAARRSGHNPDSGGVVRAWDVTHDPAGGCDAHALADRLLAEQDPRLRYVISRRQIGSGPSGIQPGRWRPYGGDNPHDRHVHIEVVLSDAGDRDGPWQNVTPRTSAPTQEDDDMTPSQSQQLAQTAAGVDELKREVDGIRRDLREVGEALKLAVRDRSKLDGTIES